jgi:glutamine synthetase
MLIKNAIPVIQKYLKSSRPIRFSGDNYSQEWINEAKKRKLPNIKKAIDSYKSLNSPKTIQAFKGILTENELHSRYEVMAEHYAHTLHIEAKLMLDMFRTQILPATLIHQESLARSIQTTQSVLGKSAKMSKQLDHLKNLTEHIEDAIKLSDDMDKLRLKLVDLPMFEQAKAFSDQMGPKAEEFRHVVDTLESIVDDKLWPLPKYRELLFMI